MITFWIVCAGLLVIALAFILPPLLERSATNQEKDGKGRREANLAVYRDHIAELEADLRNGIVSQEQYNQDVEELERRLLEDVADSSVATVSRATTSGTSKTVPYAIALVIPVMAIVFYLQVGSPNAISASTTALSGSSTRAQSASDNSFTQQRIEANVAALAKRLEQNPGDAQGWAMLGRSYISLERYSDATEAFAKATALKNDDADLLADYAFALAMSTGQSLRGQPAALIIKALKIDPENPKALELAGSAAFEEKNYAKAIEYWQHLLQKTPANSELTQALQDRIAEARKLLGPR